MKRGFLNTQKAKQRVSEAVDAESARAEEPPHTKDKDAKRESAHPRTRAEYTDFNTINFHKLPNIIQQQADNEEHCVGYGKSRVVFRVWPRDPKGDTITVSPLRGKELSNGIDLWGATLYDFYWVLRAPDVKNYLTISTGSRLAKWMRQHGELIAEDELYSADKEDDPKEIPVVDIGELIRCYDVRVTLGIFNQFSNRKEVREKEKTGWSVLSYSDLEKATDGEDSTPPADDQSNSIGREKEEKAASAADEHSKENATASASFHDYMQEMPNINSPFHPDHYPSPYPFIPFTHETPVLQQRIPLHLLPQKLYVHDPWDKLTVEDSDSDHETQWPSKIANDGYILRTYSLSLSREGQEVASKARELAEIAEDEAAKKESVLHIFPTDKEGPTEEPLIEVVLPLRPRKRTQVEEAHLYLSPRAVGFGHHSIVHSVEWELPRDLFVEARLCKDCVEEDVRRQVQKLKDEGKWEALFKDPGEKTEETMQGSSGREPSQASGPKRTLGHVTIEEHQFPEVTGSYVLRPHWDSRPGGEKSTDGNDAPSSDEYHPADTASDAMTTEDAETDVKIDAVDGQDLEPAAKTEHEDVPDACMDVDDGQTCALESAPKEDKGKGKGKMKIDQDNSDEEKDLVESEDEQSEEYSEDETFILEPPRVIRTTSYSGPVLRIHTTVQWRNPWEEQCNHESSSFGSGPVPRTAIVGAVAKLSFKYDLHLAQEAKNYQSFPDHFFQHWNGYNVIPPIHDPIPVGALCPQFYGYYTPDNPTGDKYWGRCRYMSPILLLEYCGREIDPDDLCQDDKQECASLIIRFNCAGWLHGSFAARNIMWQQGKPTEWPIDRPHSSKSFRLIDFGRSEKRKGQPMGEEEVAFRLLNLLHREKGKCQTKKK